ncbi:DUF4350 domain-containing protein [Paramicrobacterium agarici]|uniref:DUF4350 domain-containing protein n=1 Tax=Paramicrobacterium agarici TaxID=630514 RepID=A0A2A9DWX4_9MICO|nr:DUF4350 domain-containing protein [Microbacterium agarici]PFG30851.1 hypothetical protein ATJ78_1793 [Microbacterium agarici]
MSIAESLTPTVRTRLRRAGFWMVCAVGALVITLIAIALTGGNAAQTRPLQADSPAPSGAKGLVTVLEEHGVSITTADSATDAAEGLAGAHATLFVYDESGFLDARGLSQLAEKAANVVIMTPDFADLREIAPGVRAGGAEPDDAAPVAAQCTVPAAQAAQTADVLYTFRIDNGVDAHGCFPATDGRYGLVAIPRAAGPLTLLGDPNAFSNEAILHGGNAALALNLLGANDELVWYLPTIADVETDAPPTLGELTPPWVVPFTVLLALTAIAAMFWRGRRLGPVVVEKLPVHVPARETVEGRARLYERGNARVHAIDTLRMGAVSRLAGLLGLPPSTTAWQVADATASLLARDPRQVRAVLVDDLPSSDSQLMALSDAVNDLETRVRATIDETGRM